MLWCDSDSTVSSGCGVLQGSGLRVESFDEPKALLQRYLRNPQDVRCVMSSMMEGAGRKELDRIS